MKQKKLYKVGVAVALVLAVAGALWFVSPVSAFDIDITNPESGTLGESYSFTIEVNIEDAELLPIQRVDLYIYKSDARGTYEATCANLPLTTTVTPYTALTATGTFPYRGAISVTVSAVSWGWSYGYGYAVWQGTTYHFFAPSGRGYGYGPGPASITYDVVWTSPASWPAGDYKIESKVITSATTEDGRTEFTKTKSFTLYVGEAVWTLELGESWNIISTPIALKPACNNWNEFVAMGDGLDYEIAYYYDPLSSPPWVLLPTTSTHVYTPCEGVYIKMKSADIAQIYPSTELSAPASKELYAGWNLVGLAHLPQGTEIGLPVNEALLSVEHVTGDLTGYTQVVSPGLNQGAWIYISGGTTAPPMQIGKGCWVFMVNNGTLAGFTSTPWTP